MRTTKITCDRCYKEIIPRTWLRKIAVLHEGDDEHPIMVKDLCPECYRNFENFFRNVRVEASK